MIRGLRDSGSQARRIACGLALGVEFASSLARANEPSIELSEPDAGCTSPDLLEQRVRELTVRGAVPSRARVVVTLTGTGYRTEVSLLSSGEQRARVFETETCEAGVEAAALVIALGSPSTTTPPGAATASPPGAANASAPVSLAAITSAASPSAVEEADTAPRPPVDSEAQRIRPPNPAARRISVRAVVDFGFDGYALPNVAPLARLGASVALGERYWIEASAVAAPSQDVTSAGALAHFTLFGAALRGCYLEPARGFEIGPCLGASAYRIRGQGIIAQARSGAEWYGGPTVGVLGRWPVAERVSLRASLEGLGAPSSQAFNIDGARVYTPGKIDLSGAAGCDFLF